MTPGKLYHITAAINMPQHTFEVAAVLLNNRNDTHLWLVLASSAPAGDSRGLYETGNYGLRLGTWTAEEIQTDQLPAFLHWPIIRPDMDRVIAGEDPNDLPTALLWRTVDSRVRVAIAREGRS